MAHSNKKRNQGDAKYYYQWWVPEFPNGEGTVPFWCIGSDSAFKKTTTILDIIFDTLCAVEKGNRGGLLDEEEGKGVYSFCISH